MSDDVECAGMPRAPYVLGSESIGGHVRDANVAPWPVFCSAPAREVAAGVVAVLHRNG